MDRETYHRELKQRIDEVLYYIWDPINVSDAPRSRDEYRTYASQVYRDVLEGKTKEEVSAFLTHVTREQMGLLPQKKHDNKVSEIIFEWTNVLQEEPTA